MAEATTASTTTEHTVIVDAATERAIERFLYEEAHLLDTWQFTTWLELLAADISYAAPVRENRTYRERKHEIAPPGTSAYFEEDLDLLKERVDRLQTHMAWAEEPPSRTRHLVTNVIVDRTDDAEVFAVRSNLCVYRTRSERDEDIIYGRRVDVIRRSDSPWGFELVRRTVIFDQATLLVKNLSSFY
ncbi:MAG TPA: 3-phenylpropionate/cinnamic acid dioxygenase subunit beta [Intrasporangium sp.]|nr:3-phenylpropionate/cinnamic acid dioxygenase subunit beta [Intrasporangium sp.]